MAHIKPINKVTFSDWMNKPELYDGITEGLAELPLPEYLRINRKNYAIPGDVNEFTSKICYGQRMFLSVSEPNDFGVILRLTDGYYYPIVTGKKWDGENALLFGKNILTCTIKDLYPVSMHLATLFKEMADRELQLLQREPSKMELAAGIEKLSVYSDLNALDFLRDAMKIPVSEVLLTPYNECLVRFMNAKEILEYQERYQQIQLEVMKSKKKPYAKE